MRGFNQENILRELLFKEERYSHIKVLGLYNTSGWWRAILRSTVNAGAGFPNADIELS
jgi:hypothetical protein